MNSDEIVFDEIKYREPARLRRPDRDRRFACMAYEVPGTDDLPIFLDRATADAIERHALRDTSVELGGILLGKECVDDQTGLPFVWITQSLEAKHYENTQASFTYTHDSWEEITRERDQQYPDLDIVGWYHTHPDFGIFLSSHDLFIQHHFFAQPLQVAYVVDPIRQTRGFFQWRRETMVQVGGFFLSADRSDRVALSRLVNDLENLPNPEGGGGGFSPRLEAELIAMLSRPATQYHTGTSFDRSTFSLLYALVGAMLGVVALSAVLWINTLNNQIQEQAHAIEGLRQSIEADADSRRMLIDATLEADPTIDAQRFKSTYDKALRDRETLKKRADMQNEVNVALADKNKVLTSQLGSALKDVEKLKAYADDARKARELGSEVEKLREENERQARKLAQLGDLLDTPEGQKLAELMARNDRTWYSAVAGWSVSLLLLLCLIGGYAYLNNPIDESPSPDHVPPIDPTTHRIS